MGLEGQHRQNISSCFVDQRDLVETSLAGNHGVLVNRGIIDAIRILFKMGNSAGVEHVLVGSHAQGCLFSAQCLRGECSRGDHVAILASRIENRGASPNLHGRCSVAVTINVHGFVVCKMKVIADVDDNAVSNLQISHSVPPMLKPRGVLVRWIRSLLQETFLKFLRLCRKSSNGVLQGLFFVFGFRQRQCGWQKSFQCVLDGWNGQFRKG
mmetsp:Transcript_1581/g.3691  ORF Transcript_1581/g.3691 Transcript_1581/m.3691 type:complete len:211 (-) Transcript_1581:354-986(-)